MSFLQSVSTILRDLGWGNGLIYLLAQGLLRLSGGYIRIIKYDLVVQTVAVEPLLPIHRGQSIRVYEAGSDDPLLSAVPGRRDGVFQERFARGARCLVAELRGELAGCLWFTNGDYLEDEVRCLFRPEPRGRSVWDYDVYVAPQHRLSPVFLKLWQEANQCLRAEGIQYTCSRISAFNRASRGAHERLGAQTVGWVVFLCAGSWQLMGASRKPILHVSFGGNRRPVLRVGLL